MENNISLERLLDEIHKKPDLYIRARSVVYLRIFLDGFFCALVKTDREIAEQLGTDLRKFQEWVVAKYRVTGNHSWDQVVMFYSCNEIDGFDLFYRLYYEFCSQKN